MHLKEVWVLGTNRDEEMHVGTMVFKMAALLYGFKVCEHFCEFVMRIIVLLYCHQVERYIFSFKQVKCYRRRRINIFIAGFLA